MTDQRGGGHGARGMMEAVTKGGLTMTVKKVKNGYKVVSPSGHAFSKKPQTKRKAQAQLRAIEASKHRRGKK